MANKKSGIIGELSGNWKRHAWFVLSSAAIGLAVAGVVIVFLLVFRSGGSDSPASGTPTVSLDIPSPVAPEQASRSAAADILANKTLDTMTAAERDTLKTEIARAYDDVAFRASSGIVPAIDIYRVGGTTRVTRQFKAGATPGTNVTVQTLVFYCDSADGNLDAFGYNIEPGDVRSGGTALKAHTQPFDALMSGLDWSQAKDLGFQTIAGHRTHGFEMPFNSPATGTTTPTRSWFDVDSARIIEREQPSLGDSATYVFDWSVPAPVEIPAGQPVAGCAEAFFAKVPSARPAEAAPAATAVASATP